MLEMLRIEAEASCAVHGHKIAWERPVSGNTRSVQLGKCELCNDWVQLNTFPLYDDIKIGGPALESDCESRILGCTVPETSH